MGFGDIIVIKNLGAGIYTGSLAGPIASLGASEGGIFYGAEKILILLKVSAFVVGGSILIDTSVDGITWTTGGFIGKATVNAVGVYPITWINVPISFLSFSYSFGATTDSITLTGIDIMGSNS